MGGGAWPFLVGGAICLVNSDNERDSGMLTSYATPERSASPNFLEGQVAFSHPRLSNNRSVMPLDVRGCTRATLTGSACAYPTPAGAGNPLNPIRDGDRGLQLFPMNRERLLVTSAPCGGNPDGCHKHTFLLGRGFNPQTTVSRSACDRRLTSFCYGTCPMLG